MRYQLLQGRRSGPISGLVARWTMDDTWDDSGPNNLDGTASGAAFSATHAPGFTKSGDFAAGYVDVGTSSVLDLEASMPFSVAVWINPVSGDNQAIFMSTKANVGGWGLALRRGAGNGGGDYLDLMEVAVYDNIISQSISNGTWTHLAAVQQSDMSVDWYVNGSYVGTSNGNSFYSGAGQSKVIGYCSGIGTLGSYYGLMNDLRLYGRALTASEVSRVYNGEV